MHTAAIPIPGYPDYSVTSEGVVYYKGVPKKLLKKQGLSPKLRIKQNGSTRELGLAKIIANAFIPNPHNYERICFKDGNPHHCTAANISWISNNHFVRYRQHPGNPAERPLKPPATKKKRKVVTIEPCTDPSAVPLPGFMGYYITPCAKLYRGNQLLRPQNQEKKKSLQLRIHYQGKAWYLGLAKLVAIAFIPNLRGYKRIIFNDRNNKNCSVDNIRWASETEYNNYTESFKPNSQPCDAAVTHEGTPIPGHHGYRITTCGKVYCGQRQLKNLITPGRADRVKLRTTAGKLVRIAVAKLLAITYIPNPDEHTHIIFKDRNRNNCSIENISWASQSDYLRFGRSNAESYELLGPPRSRKLREPDWIDPERIPMINCPGYYITPRGIVYKGNRIIRPVCKKGKSLCIRIHLKGWSKGQTVSLGMGKLVAEHFVPNPRRFKYIIYKDRNNRNCCADNIAWVDGQTFTYYSGIIKGARKKTLTREEAIRKCTDVYLREYYKTLDESWLHDCWNEIEKKITIHRWEVFRADCYLYFWDRAKRFSIIKNPVGLMVLHAKNLKLKMLQEMSPDIPMKVLKRTDESLRKISANFRNIDVTYEYWY